MQHLWSPWRMAYLVGAKVDGCILCQKLAENADEANLVVHRGKHSFIVLNLYPYNNGHLMVVPNRHVPSLENLDAEELLDLMMMVNLALAALRNSMSPGGFNIGVNLGKAAGAGIDGHVHVHVVPRWQGDTNFMPVLAETRVIPESLPDTRQRLADAIKSILPRPDYPGAIA
ncbi:MAG: HIT family protein [Anaerolineae bacterium]